MAQLIAWQNGIDLLWQLSYSLATELLQ